MHQLDLFDYQKVQPKKRAELLLIKGNNFLLLPRPRRFYLADYETLALVLALLMLGLPFVSSRQAKPQYVQEAKMILGEQVQVIPQIVTASGGIPPSFSKITSSGGTVNPPVPPPKPAPSKPPVASVSLPILMYHHVAWEDAYTNALDRALTVSPKEFEEQVVYFKNLGYETVTLGEVYEALTTGRELPQHPLVFTFDDGYQDVFVNAVPILKKYSYTATFAIAPFLLGGGNYASWGQVLSAHQDGMEIVSHTLNHVDLTSRAYSEEDLTTELLGSKLFLESRLSASVDFFVYPYGKYDQRAMAAVEKAGYKMALTTEFGTTISLNKAFHNPRVRVSGENGLEKLIKTLKFRLAKN